MPVVQGKSKRSLFFRTAPQKTFITPGFEGATSNAPKESKVFWFLRPDDEAAQLRSLNRAA
jgi:hypothetical protein